MLSAMRDTNSLWTLSSRMCNLAGLQETDQIDFVEENHIQTGLRKSCLTFYYITCVSSLSIDVCVLSRAFLFEIPWTVACQAPLSMEFSRQQYWSGLPFPASGDLLSPGIEHTSPPSPALVGRFFTTEPSKKPFYLYNGILNAGISFTTPFYLLTVPILCFSCFIIT